MKRLIILSTLVFFVSPYTFGQSGKKGIKKDTVHVDGVCELCQKRIQEAAYLKGVKRADWDKHNQELVVIYKPKKVNLLEIEKSVAKAGHNAGPVKATEAAYHQLPECCAYRELDPH